MPCAMFHHLAQCVFSTHVQHVHASIQDNFVLMKGYTDFGAEVEYLYNPKSGEAADLNRFLQ